MARYKQDSVAIGDRDLNSSKNNDPAEAWTAGEITTEETALTDNALNIKARVIIASGDYVKVKWYHRGKPLAIFKSRDYVRAEALAFLEEVKNDYDVYSTAGLDDVTLLDATIADNTLTVAQTSQITVNATNTATTITNVTSSCTFSTSDATKATVSSTGLVTGVAAGAVTITCTYRNETDTVSVTVS